MSAHMFLWRNAEKKQKQIIIKYTDTTAITSNTLFQQSENFILTIQLKQLAVELWNKQYSFNKTYKSYK